MRLLLHLALGLVVSLPAIADTPKLLVLSPRAARTSDRDLGVVVGELIVDAAGRARGLTIVAEQEATAFLDPSTRKQLDGCADDGACMIEIGGALGVSYLLAPALGGIGDQFLLTLRLFDAREGTLIARMNQTLARDEKVLAAALCPKVQELFSLAAAQGVPVLAQPASCGLKADASTAAPPPDELPSPPIPPTPTVVRIEPKAEPPKAEVKPVREGALVALLAATLADESIEPARKRERLRFERALGDAELVRAIAQARPADLRRELCMPYVGKGSGAPLVVRARDDDGSPVQGVVTIDGVRIGVTGAMTSAPVCASTVLVEDPRTGAWWAGELRFASSGLTEVTARFPGLRYEFDRNIARDRQERRTWFRRPAIDRVGNDAAAWCASLADDGGGWVAPTRAELESTRVPSTPDGFDTVLFNGLGPRSGAQLRFGAADGEVLFPPASTAGRENTTSSVTCVRRHPRFAVRAGVGALSGVVGLGFEWRPLRLVGVALGFGANNPTFGLSLNRGDGESGWFLDAHVLRIAQDAGSRLGGGVTGGWDQRFWQRFSVKLGGGLSLHGTAWPVLLEANAGVVW